MTFVRRRAAALVEALAIGLIVGLLVAVGVWMYPGFESRKRTAQAIKHVTAIVHALHEYRSHCGALPGPGGVFPRHPSDRCLPGGHASDPTLAFAHFNGNTVVGPFLLASPPRLPQPPPGWTYTIEAPTPDTFWVIADPGATGDNDNEIVVARLLPESLQRPDDPQGVRWSGARPVPRHLLGGLIPLP